MKIFKRALNLLILFLLSVSCNTGEASVAEPQTEWTRNSLNPVLRDIYQGGGYQSASDGHVFYDDQGTLRMIYSGDYNYNSSIKLATGSSMANWQIETPLLFEANTENTDIHKETAFYRKANNGKHQIFYIGYEDGATYESQLFLAQSDNLNGPYTQITQPIVERGNLAGKLVYCMTSPSVIEHNGLLYIVFIGWNDNPNNATEVWVIGATSSDDGYTWTNFQTVDAAIAMEGQITKTPDGNYVAVKTAEYQDVEAIYYATSSHPFGPWNMSETPILIQNNTVLEKDEIIAPQIVFDTQTGKEHLFYTGADHDLGWWIMQASKE